MSTIYQRKTYVDRILPFIDKDLIKVFTGQRRVGKSCLMLQTSELIKKTRTAANIIYINKEDYAFDNIKTDKDLYDYLQQKQLKDHKNYVFIDEIQEISNFEKVIRDINAKNNFDVYCTGSNSTMLSGELATTLSGRYIEHKIHGLSFCEFLLFHKLANSTDSLMKYLKYGGLPYLIHLELEDEIVFGYLKSIFNSIILKDVVARHNIRNVNFLERLVRYLADNVGNILSAKKISDYLKSQYIKLSPNSVLNYLSFLVDSYFIREVRRFDIIGKRLFEVNDKYYFEDLGLRHSLIGFRQIDISKIMENAVFRHLENSGYEINIGKMRNKEIDFIATKNSNKVYVQVCYLIRDQKVIDREFGNLLEIKDNYRKIVVSMDEFAQGNVKGIEHQHLRDFLTNFK